jgi:hypothetical protein
VAVLHKRVITAPVTSLRLDVWDGPEAVRVRALNDTISWSLEVGSAYGARQLGERSVDGGELRSSAAASASRRIG